MNKATNVFSLTSFLQISFDWYIIFKYLLLFELHFITEIEIAISYIFCEKESIDQFTMSINEENRQLFGQVFLLPLIIFPINQATKPLH